MSSLTADITDTNFLLDDLLHQLALHSDYSLLKSIKAAYTDIHHTRQTQQAAVKAAIQQLTANIDGLEEGVRSVRVTEVKAWKEGVKGSVREAEDEVEGLKWEEARLTAAVAVKEEEGRLLEQRRVDKLRRHAERMQSHKKCLRLYSILSAVRFDAVDDAVIRGSTPQPSSTHHAHTRPPLHPPPVHARPHALPSSVLSVSVPRLGQRAEVVHVQPRRGGSCGGCDGVRRHQPAVGAAVEPGRA